MSLQTSVLIETEEVSVEVFNAQNKNKSIKYDHDCFIIKKGSKGKHGSLKWAYCACHSFMWEFLESEWLLSCRYRNSTMWCHLSIQSWVQLNVRMQEGDSSNGQVFRRTLKLICSHMSCYTTSLLQHNNRQW